MDCAVEMPRYQSHKRVWALQIANIEDKGDGGATITPVEAGYAPFDVSAEYVSKHAPDVGGFYVVYPDGHKSWSPEAAFKNGYTPLDR